MQFSCNATTTSASDLCVVHKCDCEAALQGVLTYCAFFNQKIYHIKLNHTVGLWDYSMQKNRKTDFERGIALITGVNSVLDEM